MSTIVSALSDRHSAAGTTAEGHGFEVHYYHGLHTTDLLGCHSLSILNLGNVHITGITFGGSTEGRKTENSLKSSIEKIPPKWLKYLTIDMVRDAVYTHVMIRFCRPGFIIFSDRINRRTAAGGDDYGVPFNGEYFNCAALAKWLAKHPELGVLTASPIVNNPNYSVPTNFALAQVFVFVPKDRLAFTEEAEITGPDINMSKEEYLKNVENKFKEDKYATNPGHPMAEYSKVTYL